LNIIHRFLLVYFDFCFSDFFKREMDMYGLLSADSDYSLDVF